MLKSLFLKNFAIVDSLELNFEDGFSVLTGETGAGKSILLDALFFLLGEKADYSKIKQGQDEAQLAAVFTLAGLNGVRQFLEEHGFSSKEDELYIKRIINAAGKSRSFINGEPITLSQLKVLGALLVVIHGQNTQQYLTTESKQRQLLDAFAGAGKLAYETAHRFQLWQLAESELAAAAELQNNRQDEIEKLLWQNKELSDLNPEVGEWQKLSHLYDVMNYDRELKTVTRQTESAINQEGGLQEIIAALCSRLTALTHIEPKLRDSLLILQSVETELGEVALTMRDIFARAELDPEELAALEKRLALLAGAAKKYQVDPDELAAVYAAGKSRLNKLQENEDLTALNQKISAAREEYLRLAAQLTAKRHRAAGQLAREVTELTRKLALPAALFKVDLLKTEPGKNGCEKIQFLVALNPGSALNPLNKVASGGELSRINLALQVVINADSEMPTLIFDEVDSGIGGQVADTVGSYLKLLGQHRQIFAITHLPQVAVYGRQHYLVSKTNTAAGAVSKAVMLPPAARTEEIARMLGGGKITALTRRHAEELLSLAAD